MERLTANDLAMLWPDDMGWPQDIGALTVFDGNSVVDGQGHFSIGDARSVIERRLALIPQFRRVLLVPRKGLGWPLWVDATGVDLTYHVHMLEVPAPGDEHQLLLAVEGLRRRQWDRERPLWRMWFLTGLTDGRIGLFMRLHHTIADGVSGIAMLAAFLDTDPTASAPPVPSPIAAPRPSAGELFADNLRRRTRGLAGAIVGVTRLRSKLRDLRESWPALREAFVEERAPRTSLNRPIGVGRRLALVRSSLEAAKQIAHAQDATVNDVLMTAMAGGLRALLLGRGEGVEGIALRAYVPMSLHREPPGKARGNLDGMMVVRLPVGVADPIDRLRMIAAETAGRRKLRRAAGGALFRFSLLQRLLMRLMSRQRWANTYAANVPGPPMPLYFAGARLLELFPLVPLTGNITVGIGALSYAGQFNITVVTDEDACPDIDMCAQGIQDALNSLATALIPADRNNR